MSDVIVRLLGCSEPKAQSGAALTISTLAGIGNVQVTSGSTRFDSHREMVEGGIVAALLPLLASRSIAVQTHVTGAITALTSSSSAYVGESSAISTTSRSSTSLEATSNVHNHLLTLGAVPSLLQLLRPPHLEDAVLTNNVVGSLLNFSHYQCGE